VDQGDIREWSPKELRRRGNNLEKPVIVDSAIQVASLDEAANVLEISVARVRVLANSGFLEPCVQPGGTVGVSRRSLASEQQWRATAGPVRKLGRLLFHFLRNVS
jgi:hypothetical protein